MSPAAPGLRAIASAADATPRPCASAPSPAAKASAKPAVMIDHLAISVFARRRAGVLRVHRGEARARDQHESGCQNGTFAHDPSLLMNDQTNQSNCDARAHAAAGA